MQFKHLMEKAGVNAREHGWWDKPPSFGEFVALCHSELSEALEEHRNGKGLNELYYIDGKPEGIPAELADVVIRIFDYCYNQNIDLEWALKQKMAYNKTRPYRHGGKVL